MTEGKTQRTEKVMRYCSCLLEVSIQKPLDYLIPDELLGSVRRGVYIEVPLRNKTVRAFVLDVKEISEVPNPKPIQSVITEEVVTAELFELALFMARYYITPLGKVLKTMLPAGVRKRTQVKQQYIVFRKKTKVDILHAIPEFLNSAPQQAKILEAMLKVRKEIFLSELLEKTDAAASSVKALVEKGYLSIDIVRSDRSPVINAEYFRTKPKELLIEQKHALDTIVDSLQNKQFAVHLIHGVTGSGKTEVYLQAIDYALKKNRGVIFLVPEISLTPQTIQRLRSRFDVPITALHHRLSDGERQEAWEMIREGKSPLVIGARSSIFSPMPNLGLIIVDEEHEPSYKQSEDSPCYHARDVAIMRAKLEGSVCVLGSATPSIETYHNAISGKYRLSTLRSRPESSRLPQVSIVDMKREYEKAKGITSFSELLLQKLDERKRRGEQSILFLNRRGYHTLIKCLSCRNTLKCLHCDTSLTYHRETNLITCHLCGFTDRTPKVCPSCNSHDMMKFQGAGTEKVEAALKAIFPEMRTIRVDADTTRHKGSLDLLLQQFRSGKAEVMIGTQMIAKGLHFPEVTLVGIINVDSTLHLPDFRAQETAFQLITQVAGRAGRGVHPGEVIIQTTLPESATITLAAEQNYVAFYEQEIEARKLFLFPPFSRIVKFIFSGARETQVEEAAVQFATRLQSELPSSFHCHPGLPCGHSKIKDQFRYQCLIRGPSVSDVIRALEIVDRQYTIPSSVSRFIDVDPSSTFF